MRLLLVLLLVGCEEGPAPVPLPEPIPRFGSARMVRDLSIMAVGSAPTQAEAQATAQRLREGSTTYGAVIDELLRSKKVATATARKIVFKSSQGTKGHLVPKHSVLMVDRTREEEIHHLRGVCELEETVEVSPWWAPETKVRICERDHRPEVSVAEDGRRCGASTLSPAREDICGCGPRLIFCTPSAGSRSALIQSAQREVSRTFAWVIEQDLPIEQAFLMNETVRDRNAELLYRRARIAGGEDPALVEAEDFEPRHEPQPRHEPRPGHHAGILSTPSVTTSSDALRGVMRNVYGYLWCVGPQSSRVTTQAVLGLGVVDLRAGDGWQQLASMDICTDCHARLDYGMQFFGGYPNAATVGVDFRLGEAHEGEGPLYVSDIGDERGRAPLTPQGFAQLAVAQPEYSACMVQGVLDHVFSGSESSEDRDAVREAFKETRRFKPTLRAALLRFAERAETPGADLQAPLPAPGPELDPAETLPVPEAVSQLISLYCVGCHTPGGSREELHHSELSREVLASSLELVAFGQMPRAPVSLPEAERRTFIDALTPALWPEGDARQAARAYFTGGLRAHPVHAFRSALQAVAVQAGASTGLSISAIEPVADQPRLRHSPGVSAAAALTALDKCRALDRSGPELEAYVQRASAPEVLIVGPAH